MRQAGGNPDKELRYALVFVVWQKLDQPPDGAFTDTAVMREKTKQCKTSITRDRSKIRAAG
jgi:hypothetical protein